MRFPRLGILAALPFAVTVAAAACSSTPPTGSGTTGSGGAGAAGSSSSGATTGTGGGGTSSSTGTGGATTSSTSGATSTSGSGSGSGSTSTSGSTSSSSSSSSSSGATCPGGCTTPPSACYGTPGSCVNGTCSYPFVTGASCDDGDPCTVADTCTGGACTGTPKVCDTPPAPVCVSGTDLVTYDTTGTCTSGICVYQKHQTACSGGPCANNACQVDPCASITCNMPPSSCYGAAGVCQNGSCSYPYANGVGCNDADPCTVGDVCNAGVCKGAPMACNTPPPNTCSGSTLQVYAATGTCSAGTCGYSSSFVSCATGCANGMCNSAGWTTMTSNTNNDLYGVWGSSASAVWAVGDLGTAVFYNGVQWQVRSPATSTLLYSVSGTAANNVFAAGADRNVYKFDGTSWAIHAKVPLATATKMGVFADGIDTLWIGVDDTTGGGGGTMKLYRSVSGVVTLVGPTASGSYLAAHGASLWAFSPTDVWMSGTTAGHYAGTLPLANEQVGAFGIWGSSTSQVFLGFNATLYRWNGATFDTYNTGLNATIYGVSGTAPNRVFGAMWYNFMNAGAVFYFDGVGITQQPIPAGTPLLNAIWAAPTGEVFAVGQGGGIIRGP